MSTKPLDTVGALEIVARAATEHGKVLVADTVRSWERRRQAWVKDGRPARRARDEALPAPIGEVNGQAAWHWPEIVAWMKRTGKLEVNE